MGNLLPVLTDVYDVLAQYYQKYTKCPMYQGLEYRGQGTDRSMIYSEQPLRDLPSKIFSLEKNILWFLKIRIFL